MFGRCRSLISIDLSGFGTEQVFNMSKMFIECESLKSINLSNFNTSHLEQLSSMFEGCHSLTSINLSNFIDNKIKYIKNIFKDCPSLEYIDISSIKWNNQGQTNISEFKASKGILIISSNLYTNLIIKPKESWNVTNITYINN